MNNNVSVMPQNIAIVIDGWNVLRGADNVLNFGDRIDNYTLDLGKLSDQIAKARNRASRVRDIYVAIGLPHPEMNPRSRAVTEQLIRNWERDKRIQVIAMENDQNNREKGVDMEIGLRLVELAADPTLDTVVLFSADRDLQPAVDRTAARRGAHIELARWQGQPSALRIALNSGKRGWCHYLDADQFHQAATPRGHRLAA